MQYRCKVFMTDKPTTDERGQITPADISRIIEMAWEDRTPFEAIETQFHLNESAVISLMRREMKRSSFKMWRKRATARTTKHAVLRCNSLTEMRATES